MKGMWRVLCSVLVCLLAALPAAAAKDDARYELPMLDGKWTPPAGVSPAARQDLARQAAGLAARGEKTVHVLVQLYETPSESEKAALWRDGLDLGTYVPGSAWIAAVPAGQMAAVAARSDVRWLTLWDAARKVHPRIARNDWADWARDPERPGWVMVAVLLHHDAVLDDVYKLIDAVGGAAMPPLDGLHGATAWVPEEKVAELAGFEQVLWIEEGPPPMTPTNDGVRATMRVDPVNIAPYNLNGTGVRIFVFDGGTIRSTHETFRVGAGASRVTVIDGQPFADHPTHVGGTAAGDGAPTSAGGRGRGVAPLSTLLSAGYQQTLGTMLFWDNAGDIQADYALARNTHNADLGTNSIGSNTASNGYPCAREGDYGVSSNLLDGIVRGNNVTVGSPVIMTWANGNERSGGPPSGRCGANYLTTAPPSCAKNPIHVGAVYSDGAAMTSFSSWGPCDDGRLKPVISAPGCETGRVTGESFIYSSLSTSDTAYGGANWCGTSMATPAVGGTVALLIQDWRARGFGGANARPLPALVKSMLVHSARDLGQAGPDYIYGYGEVDAKALIDQERAGTGALGAAGPVVWGTDSITHAAVDNWTFTVPVGAGELKATLAWDDAAAPAFSVNAAVNNLTLQLIAPGGAIFNAFVLNPAIPHLPATTGLNAVDNQEQVLVPFPAPGVWTVRVTGTNVPTGPQTYGLVYNATDASYYNAGCTTTSWGYEAGNDGWTLAGAARVAAPAAGHGAFSLRLGGAVSTTHEATQNIAIPARLARAEWTFWWYMTTLEVPATGFGFDHFIAEVRNATTGVTLAVFDVRFDGWRAGQWMQQQKIDLTPWIGQTIRLTYRAVNNNLRPTTFWVDDGQLITCPLADLWHKDLPADTGVEPNPVASPMWTSPDIWIRNVADAGLAHQNPEYGQPNAIYGYIRNRGTVTPQNVRVEYWLANASTGLNWPANWTFVGAVYVSGPAPGGSVVLPPVMWTPPNIGHFCMVSRIVSAQDPMTFPEGTNISLNTQNNNNIVWRNLNIVNLVGPYPLTAGPGGRLESLGMAAVSSNLAKPVTVEFLFRNFERADRDLELAFVDRTDREAVGHGFRSRGRVIVTVSEEFAAYLEEQGLEGGVGLNRLDTATFEVVEDDAFFVLPGVRGGQEFTFQMTFEDTGVDNLPPPSDDDPTVPTVTYTIDAVQREPGKEPEGGVTYEVEALGVALTKPVTPKQVAK
jgi:Subtilase family